MPHAAPLPVVRLPMYPKLKVYQSISWTEKYRDFSISGLHTTKGSARRSIAMNEYGVSLLGVVPSALQSQETKPKPAAKPNL